ncbi:MAG: response regulator transcription factor [Thermoanaerobaculia bacterium]
MKVLVVEDSERLRRSLGEGLRRSGFAVDLVDNGDDGLEYATHGDHDVIVLDLMLPKLDGLSVLRRLRALSKKTHVLVLSARDRVDDRIEVLNAGADDYLVKPFSFDELLARIHALVRRSYAQKDPKVRVGNLEIDTLAKAVRLDGKPVDLSAMEYSLLELLVLRRGRILGREEILDRLYASGLEPSSNIVEAMIYSLRQKVQPRGSPPLIVNRRGQGYLIEAS